MISSAVVPVWTPRRRLIAILLVLTWIAIGGIFLAALLDSQPTTATYGDDTSSITLTTDKSLALAYLQCIHFTWSSDNVPLYKMSDPSFPREEQPLTGDRIACNSADAHVVGEFNNSRLNNVYPRTTWINPAALLYIGIAAIAGAIILWCPQWIGTNQPNRTHLILVLFFTSLALLIQVLNPLDVNLTIVPALIALVPLSVLGFVMVYAFRQHASQIFVVACGLMLTVTVLLAAYHMFTIPGMLNADERYYASIAATGANGLGLYPYIQNYPPMPIMGGVGHLAWLYTAAYKVFGPTIWGPRLVAFLWYLLAMPAIFLLFRRLYGSATAWLALALVPTTYFYTLSLSARLDSVTLTMLWCGLLLVDTARRKQDWRWHMAAGLFMGLGLQAHIHTSITTIACGILYLADYVGEVRRAGKLVWPRAVIAYSIGALLGLGVFVVANILPNPDAFLRTAGNAARLTVVTVEKNLTLPERVLRSFLAIESFAETSIRRILYIFEYIPPQGIIVGLIAFVTLVVRRRTPADRTALILIGGVLLAGFFILNGPSLYYTLHLLPVTVLCLPSFFTHGYLRRGPFLVSWKDVSPALLLVLLPVIFPLYIAFSVVSPSAVGYDIAIADQYAQEITYIETHVSHECIILGSGPIYELKMMAYPRYNTYTAEGGLALFYYGFKDASQLWPLLNPDIAFGRLDAEFGKSLQTYIEQKNYKEIAPGIWMKTEAPLTPGCTVTGVVP